MVKSLLSLLASRQNNILTGATILMVTIFAAKFLGLIRNRLLFHNFDTATASIFFGAFQLPELLFQLLIFGTLSVAFIPVFTEFLHKKGEEEAYSFASDILNLSLIVFGITCLLAAVFVEPLNSIFAPGFTGEQKEMTNQLTRIILVGQVVLVVGSFFVGVAQSYQRFIVSALAPLFYNIGIIMGIFFLSPIVGITGPAYGVILGAILHVLVQIPIIRSLGFKYRLSFDLFNSGVREIFRLMSIRTIGLAVEQINEKVGFALATLISLSSPAIFTVSQQLHFVPIGLFGATIAQAAFPVLAREHAKGEEESFKITLLTTMHQILFLTLPAAAILIVLRIPVVRLVFGASQFSWADTVLTGRTVAFLSVGLAAQAVMLLLVRGFYAMRDTKTPVTVSIITVVVNVVLSFLFIQYFHLDVWSLGLSYAIASNTGWFILMYFLSKKAGGFDLKSLTFPAMKMLLAALMAALALYIPIKALDQLVIDTTKTINLIGLTAIASAFGLSIYLLLVWLLQVEEIKTFWNIFKKIYRRQFKVKESEKLIEERTPV